jgi:hypothetical protein
VQAAVSAAVIELTAERVGRGAIVTGIVPLNAGVPGVTR